MFTTMHCDPNRRRRFPNQFRRLHRGGVDRHLIAPCIEQQADIVDGPNPATDGERHETDFRRPPHDIEHDAPLLVTRRDVEKHQLIGPIGFILGRDLHRIAGVPQVQKIDPFNHAPGMDIETRDDAFGEHGMKSRDEEGY